MIFKRKTKRMYCEYCEVSFTGVFELRFRKFRIVSVCPECNCTLLKQSPAEKLRKQYRISKITHANKSTYYTVSIFGSACPPRQFKTREDAREYVEHCVARSIIKIEVVE